MNMIKQMHTLGPKSQLGQEIHSAKYRSKGETFYDAMVRIAGTLSEDDDHRKLLKNDLLHQRFLPAGRIQSASGAVRRVTALNCFVSQSIEDNTESIFSALTSAFQTMRVGGGIGFDFSKLRPRNAHIVSLDSESSGPVSFMRIYDAMCKTVSSAGHRRGAMMGVMRIDHPDIEEFITAKRDNTSLTGFNLSVAVTDKFMKAVKDEKEFDLIFNGEVYKTIYAPALWDSIMRSCYDYAEPGILFIDQINKHNNLSYCETIESTNPCGEQPLPSNGCCLLGSINLVQFLADSKDGMDCVVDLRGIEDTVDTAIRALNKVIDTTIYPHKEQQEEEKNKRRIGLGITGLANVLGILGVEYGTDEAVQVTREIMRTIRNKAYRTSIELAKRDGPFPSYDKEKYNDATFIKRLPKSIRDDINSFGIRNSHLISIAPTGTISLTADNVSGGVEPVFAHHASRKIFMPQHGQITVEVKDFAYENYGVKCITADEVSVKGHVDMLCAAQEFVDSAVSKTINVGEEVTWEEFKDVYRSAYDGGAKGCATFRLAGKRFGIMEKVEEETDESCSFDPETGMRGCSE